MKNKTYDTFKWLFLIVAPASAVLVGVLGDTWGLPNTQAWVTTINAIGVFGGAVLGVSNYNFKQTHTVEVIEHE